MRGNSVAEVRLDLPELPPQGLPQETYAAVLSIHNAIRKLQSTLNYEVGLTGEAPQYWSQLTPTEGVSDARSRLYLRCAETISYGQAVNVFLNGSELQARLAVASDPLKLVSAFCHSEGSFDAGEVAEFFLPPCLIESVGGLTPGSWYWLSVVPGILTPIEPTGAGVEVQLIGQALETNKLWYMPSQGGGGGTTIIDDTGNIDGGSASTVFEVGSVINGGGASG
jgi:hypothetical protein